MHEFSKVPSGATYDGIDWSYKPLLLGAIVVFPIKQIIEIYIYLMVWLTCAINWKLFGRGNFTDSQSSIYLKINYIIFNTLIRLMLLNNGVTSIEYKQHYISDYMSDFKEFEDIDQRNSEAPITVSNHVSSLDMKVLQLLKNCPCFLAKDAIKTLPCIGYVCTAIGSLFLKRSCEKSRLDILDKTKEKVDKFYSNKNIPSQLIFPEGTTQSGTSLMSFKKGAFVNKCDIKIRALEYIGTPSVADAVLPLVEMVTLVLSGMFKYKIIMHEFSIYKFEYALKKFKLDKDDENLWEKISDDIW